MSDLITLSRQHQNFERYLDGRFSKNLRAIAIESLNVNTQRETVTFRIVPVEDLQIPSFFLRWIKAVRIETLLNSLLPLLFVLLYFFEKRLAWDPWLSLFCVVGVISLRVAGNLLNDYFDHIKGMDRLDRHSGSQVIQKGWIPAYRFLQAGFGFLLFGILSGIPALIFQPQLLWLVGLIALIGIFQFSSQRLGFKYIGLGEIVTFVLFGPLLTFGFAWGVSGYFDLTLFLLGCVFGWLEVMVLNYKNYAHILLASQAGFRNWVVFLGFDKSKRLLELWLFVFWILLFFYSYTSTNWFHFSLLGTIYLFLSYQLMKKTRKMKSCLASESLDLIKDARLIYLTVVSTWLLYDFILLAIRVS